jgi:ABC-type polysaccharide/polyol phosphate export systems, permease component
MMSSTAQRANASLAPAVPVTIIEPSQGWVQLRLRELWDYKELLYFLVWREVKVRYKQTAIGAAWAILQPLLSMLIFSIFFGRLAKIPSDGVPYPLFSLAGLAPWTFFSNGLSQSALSLVTSSNLVKKVYFPRLIIPISSVLSGVRGSGLDPVPGPSLWALPRGFSDCQHCLAPGVRHARIHDRARSRTLAIGAQRAVSRRPLRRPVPDAVLDVRNADRLSEQPPQRALEDSLCLESDGRRGGRLSLVASEHWEFSRTNGSCFGDGRNHRFDLGSLLLPSDGKNVRGRCVA